MAKKKLKEPAMVEKITPAEAVEAAPAPVNVVMKNGYLFPASKPVCPDCGRDTMFQKQSRDVLYFRCRRVACKRNKSLISQIGRPSAR